MSIKSSVLHIVLLAVLIGAQALTPGPVLAQNAPAASMPADLYRAVVASTIPADSPTRRSDGSYSFETTGLDALLGSGGLALTARNGNAWSWNLQLDGFGRGASPAAVGRPAMSAVNGRVTSRYSGFSQWLRGSGIGLEQGFTVENRPSGAGNLVLRMQLATNLAGSLSKDNRSLSFAAKDGGTLHYSNLRAFDASGREMAARLVYTPGQVVIQVQDAGARYPLRIDPLIYFETKAVAMDGAVLDDFGFAVGISGDTAIVGAPGKGGGRGVAYILQRSGLTWNELARLSASDRAANDLFGTSVAISGNTVVVGAPGHGGRGKAYIFVKPVGGWSTTTETAGLSEFGGAGGEQFGYSVAISGSTAIVGAYGKNSNQGAAYVFARPASGWSNMTQTGALTASNGTTGDLFGYSVAISGDTALVGAYSTGNDEGEAYIFVKPGGGWSSHTETAQLLSSDSLPGDEFGYQVAISGDTAIVGAPTKNGSLGEAYVYVRPNGGWIINTENARLTASDASSNEYFGIAVAISGDTVVVGAGQKTLGPNANQGKTYLFVKPGDAWVSETESSGLTASDGAGSDRFGDSVAISGDIAMVGAYTKAVNRGAAYFYSPFRTDQNLTMGAAASPASLMPGQTVTLTASITNYGPGDAPAVLVNAALPAGLVFVKAVPSFGSYDASSGSWSVGSMAAGVTAALKIQARASNAAAGSYRSFTASVLGWDTNNADNSASVKVLVSALALTPLSIGFSNQLAGTSSATHTITARNLAAGTLALGTLSASPNFVLVNNTCSGRTLAYNATCSFGVKFTPAALSAYLGRVSLPHNALGSVNYLDLSGAGVAGNQLLTNTSFEAATLKVPSGWVKGGSWAAPDGRDCTAHHSGSCSLKFTGNGLLKSLSLTVLHSGVSGDDFLFGLWNKASAVSAAGPVDGALVQVYNGTTLVTTKSLNFARGTHAFTQSCLGLTMTGAYTRLVVIIEFNAASGTAWFDDASLTWAP